MHPFRKQYRIYLGRLVACRKVSGIAQLHRGREQSQCFKVGCSLYDFPAVLRCLIGFFGSILATLFAVFAAFAAALAVLAAVFAEPAAVLAEEVAAFAFFITVSTEDFNEFTVLAINSSDTFTLLLSASTPMVKSP